MRGTEPGRPQHHGTHLELGSLVEVCGTNAFAHNVPVGATRGQAHALLHHDVLQLRAHLPDLWWDGRGE